MQPLSRTRRTLYLSILFAAFIILIPFIILYSIGYRFNDAFSIVKTGGIFVHNDVSDMDLYINDKFEKGTGLFFQRNIFVQNLAPEIYVVKIEKESYHTWSKQLTVYPNKVTEAHSFTLPLEMEKVLVPEFQPVATTSSTTTKPKPVANPDYDDVLALFTPATTTPKAKVATTTPETSEEESRLIALRALPSFQEFDDTLGWIEKGNVSIEWNGEDDSIPYYFCDNSVCDNTIEVDYKDDIIYFDFYPGRNDILVIATKSGVYTIEADGRTPRNTIPLFEGSKLELRVSEKGEIFVRDAADDIYRIEF